jgi:hypothetical protein
VGLARRIKKFRLAAEVAQARRRIKFLVAVAEEKARGENGNVRRRLASRCDGARLAAVW